MLDSASMELFFELFSDLPRQGPGDSACTRRALSLIPPLSPADRILDIGCGTGAQTMELASNSPASIVAVDFHPPYIEELRRRAAQGGVDARVRPCVGDMTHLDFPPHEFDLVWSEGAIYIMGFDAGLVAWRDLLKPGGHLAVSELCWLRPDPPRKCAEFFAREYPAMRDIAANRMAVERSGYELVGDFTLPASAWWRDYYDPLERNLRAFRARHTGNAPADAIATETEREIELYRTFSDWYGYVFFVMRRRAPRGATAFRPSPPPEEPWHARS